MKVAAARCGQAEFQGQIGIDRIFVRTVAAGHDLHALAAEFLELGKQRIFLVMAQVVTCRVGNHGHAAGIHDPAHGVLQIRPDMGDITGLAFGQIAFEDLIGVAADSALHEKAREVGARDQLGVACMAQCSFIGAGNAGQFQLPGHFAGAWAATVASVVQALGQSCVIGVKAQAHDMYAAAREADGNFSACQIVQPR